MAVTTGSFPDSCLPASTDPEKVVLVIEVLGRDPKRKKSHANEEVDTKKEQKEWYEMVKIKYNEYKICAYLASGIIANIVMLLLLLILTLPGLFSSVMLRLAPSIQSLEQKIQYIYITYNYCQKAGTIGYKTFHLSSPLIGFLQKSMNIKKIKKTNNSSFQFRNGASFQNPKTRIAV